MLNNCPHHLNFACGNLWVDFAVVDQVSIGALALGKLASSAVAQLGCSVPVKNWFDGGFHFLGLFLFDSGRLAASLAFCQAEQTDPISPPPLDCALGVAVPASAMSCAVHTIRAAVVVFRAERIIVGRIVES